MLKQTNNGLDVSYENSMLSDNVSCNMSNIYRKKKRRFLYVVVCFPTKQKPSMLCCGHFSMIDLLTKEITYKVQVTR